MTLQTPLFDVDSTSLSGLAVHYSNFNGKRTPIGAIDTTTGTWSPYRGVNADDTVVDIWNFVKIPRLFGQGGDDTSTWQAAFTWLSAGGNRALRVPAGASIVSSKLTASLTGTNRMAIHVTGHHTINFASGIDGIAITRDYGASVLINVGRLELIRNTGVAGVANMALLVDYNTASPQGNQGAEGTVDISGVTVRGTAAANSWKWGAKLVATSSAIVNGFRCYQPNATGLVVETPAAFGGTPGSNGAALWLAGTKTSGGAAIFSIQTDVSGINCIGGHIGLLTSGPVQGVFGNNVCLVGNDYGHLADHVQVDTAEDVTIGDAGTFASAIASVYQLFVGNTEIGVCQHFRFGGAPTASATASAASTTSTVSVNSTAGIVAGMLLSGTGVPAPTNAAPLGTRVLSVGTTSVTLNQAVNIANGASLTFTGTWSAIHFLECNGFNVTEQNGAASLTAGEFGVWLESGQHGSGSVQPLATTSSNGVAGSAPGTVFGFSIQNIGGPWLVSQGTTNKTVTGCSANGVQAQSVDSQQNNIGGNIINGQADFYSDGAGNFYIKQPNAVVQTLIATTLAQTNAALPLSVSSVKGLWPSTDAQGSLGDFSKRWANLCLTGQIYTNNKQVVGQQINGYVAMTGTADRGTALSSETATLVQLARRVKALQDDLMSHGLISS